MRLVFEMVEFVAPCVVIGVAFGLVASIVIVFA